jgi:hypothetical protein
MSRPKSKRIVISSLRRRPPSQGQISGLSPIHANLIADDAQVEFVDRPQIHRAPVAPRGEIALSASARLRGANAVICRIAMECDPRAATVDWGNTRESDRSTRRIQVEIDCACRAVYKFQFD